MASSRVFLAIALFLLASVLDGHSARATEVIALDLPHLVAAADRIEIARVEGETAQWTADRAAIVTAVTLRIEQPLKGKLRVGDRVRVLREGGEVGSVGMRVDGAAHFVRGESVLVFLEARGGGTWTVGMAQGKMHIETVGGRAGRQWVTRDLGGLSFLGRQRPEGVPPAGVPLEELVGAITALTRDAPAGAR